MYHIDKFVDALTKNCVMFILNIHLRLASFIALPS